MTADFDLVVRFQSNLSTGYTALRAKYEKRPLGRWYIQSRKPESTISIHVITGTDAGPEVQEPTEEHRPHRTKT